MHPHHSSAMDSSSRSTPRGARPGARAASLSDALPRLCRPRFWGIMTMGSITTAGVLAPCPAPWSAPSSRVPAYACRADRHALRSTARVLVLRISSFLVAPSRQRRADLGRDRAGDIPSSPTLLLELQKPEQCTGTPNFAGNTDDCAESGPRVSAARFRPPLAAFLKTGEKRWAGAASLVRLTS